MVQVIIEGWLLGLATGPYCLGACLPFMVPYLVAEGRPTWAANGRILGEFLLGRCLAYLLFGAAVGWAGTLIRPRVSPQVLTAAVGVTAALMILYAVVKSLPCWNVCAWLLRRLPMARMPFALGFLVGINVCPPFLTAMARLVQMGAIGSGIAFFLAFFLGTSLYTAPLLAISPFVRHERVQRVGTLTAMLVGAWFLLSALLAL